MKKKKVPMINTTMRIPVEFKNIIEKKAALTGRSQNWIFIDILTKALKEGGVKEKKKEE